MSLQHIRTAIDPENFMKGDVVIVKRTYVGATSENKMLTRCTKCSGLFPTAYRRMGRIGTRRACEVRNIPQCSPCRRGKKNGPSVITITDEARLLPAHSPERDAHDAFLDAEAHARAEGEGMPS